jgi:hypothetical protein
MQCRQSGNRPISSGALFFPLLSRSFLHLDGYLCGAFCLFAAPHGLTDNTGDSLGNIYVLISDTCFRRIKGLARIHHHLLSITLFRLGLSFPQLNGYLCGAFCLFAVLHGLIDKVADTFCNIYVLISDTRFRRIKGLARIHHHLLSITLFSFSVSHFLSYMDIFAVRSIYLLLHTVLLTMRPTR